MGGRILCNDRTRPKNDNIANLLWPKIASLKRFMLEHRIDLDLIDARQICENKIAALLCSIDEKECDEIERDSNYGKPNRVRTQVNEICICISRMYHWKEKSMKIFTYDYEGDD